MNYTYSKEGEVMKNKKGIVIAIIIGLLLIIAGVLLIIFLPKKSNSELYVEAISKSLGLSKDNNELESAFKEIQNKLEKNNYKITINAEGKADEAGYAKSDVVLYLGKDKAYLTSSNNMNDFTYAAEAMLKNDNLYFNYKEILDNVYYFSKIGEMFKESDDDSFTNKIENYIVDSFIEAIDSKKVTIGYNDLTINGTEYKTKMYAYTYTGETLYNFIVKFIEKIQDDKDIYKDINKILSESGIFGESGGMTFTRDQINAILDQFVNMAVELKNIENLGMYNVYVYDDKAIGTEIILGDDNHTTIGYYNIVKDEKQYEKLSITSFNKKKVFEYEFNEKTKGNGEITIISDDKVRVKGYAKEDNGSYELKLNGVGDKEDNYILLTMKSDRTGSFKVVTDINNIEATYKIEKVDEIPEMDIQGSKPYEEMTESDKEKLESVLSMIFPSIRNTEDYGFEGLDI